MTSKRAAARRHTTPRVAVQVTPAAAASFDFDATGVTTNASPSFAAPPGGSARSKRMSKARAMQGEAMTPRKRLSTNLDSPTPKRKRGRPRKDTAVVVSSGINGTAQGTPKRIGRPPKPKPESEESVQFCTHSYFDAHRPGAQRTSNCTLADINLASSDALFAALQEAPDLLTKEKKAIVSEVCSARRLRQLMFILHAGTSLLYYGLGSKRVPLRALANKLAEHYDVLEVCGFNPGLGVRSLFGRLVDDVLKIRAPFARRALSDYVAAVRDNIGSRTIAIVIHNVDGPALRAPETHRALSSLSAIPGVLLAASVDHVNAPLLWDGATWATYAWAWVNVNSFEFYDAETVFASKNMLHGARERRVAGAVMLLRSLSVNARKVFAALAKFQMGDDDNDHGATPAAKITFNNLFESCRSAFICNDISSLRTILTELVTHEMLERRRGADAEEQIWIPLTTVEIKTVLEQVES